MHYYLATLSVNPDLTAVNIAGPVTLSCPTGPAVDTCTNTFNLTADPVGGSGNYTYQWEILEEPRSFVVLTDDTLQTCQVAIEADMTPVTQVLATIKVTVDDTVRGHQAENTAALTSDHGPPP